MDVSGLTLRSTGTIADERLQLVSVAYGRGGQLRELPKTGALDIQDGLARFLRPGLVEEYSVSMDGVRQDFV
ncbi:MAG: hypothetical protein ACI8W8_004718, partial [Rhodothermales bacterium]